MSDQRAAAAARGKLAIELRGKGKTYTEIGGGVAGSAPPSPADVGKVWTDRQTNMPVVLVDVTNRYVTTMAAGSRALVKYRIGEFSARFRVATMQEADFLSIVGHGNVTQEEERQLAADLLESARLATAYPVGTKLWRPDGRLFHVRGHVDDMVIVRFWMSHKRRWHYEAVDVTAFWVGLYSTERPKVKKRRAS